MKEKKPNLILGIGNVLKKDDGFGVHVVRWINNKIKIPDNVEAIEIGTCIFDIPYYIKDRKRVLIIDAIAKDSKVGSIFCFPYYVLESRVKNPVSLHEADIVNIIKEAKISIKKMPDIELLGVVVENVKGFGVKLSPVIKKFVPKISEMAINRVCGLKKG